MQKRRRKASFLFGGSLLLPTPTPPSSLGMTSELLMHWSSDRDQRGGDLAAFGGEHVVGAGRRTGVHRLDDDAMAAQGGAELRRDHHHARSAADQQQVYGAGVTRGGDAGETLLGQSGAFRHRPGHRLVGIDQDRALVQRAGDAKPSVTVALDDLPALRDER